MSFDVHFQPCRFDGTIERRTNPFTKQAQDFPRNEPLSDAEVRAVLALLKRAGATGPDEFGCQVIHFADGGEAEIFAEDLGKGCMFAIRGGGITPQLAQLLFDILVIGNWVIMGTGHEDVVVAPTMECLKGTPTDFGRVVVAASATEVATLLSSGFGAWKELRDRALK